MTSSVTSRACVTSSRALRATSPWCHTDRGRSLEHAKFWILKIGPLLREIRPFLWNKVFSVKILKGMVIIMVGRQGRGGGGQWRGGRAFSDLDFRDGSIFLYLFLNSNVRIGSEPPTLKKKVFFSFLIFSTKLMFWGVRFFSSFNPNKSYLLTHPLIQILTLFKF